MGVMSSFFFPTIIFFLGSTKVISFLFTYSEIIGFKDSSKIFVRLIFFWSNELANFNLLSL